MAIVTLLNTATVTAWGMDTVIATGMVTAITAMAIIGIFTSITMVISILFEYLPAVLALVSLYRYDKDDYTGPAIGMAASALFIVFGVIHSFHAISISNVIFLAINFKNLRKYL